MSDFDCDQMFCQALEAEAGFGDWTGLDPPEWSWRRGGRRRGGSGYKEPYEEYVEQEMDRMRREREEAEERRKRDEWLKNNCKKCKGYLARVDDVFHWFEGTHDAYGVVFDVEVDPFRQPGLVLTFKTKRKGIDVRTEMRTGRLKTGDCVEFWYMGEFPYCYDMVTVPVRSDWTDAEIRKLMCKKER